MVGIRTKAVSSATIEELLRHGERPIICRVSDDQVLFDLRTIDAEEVVEIGDAVQALVAGGALI